MELRTSHQGYPSPSSCRLPGSKRKGPRVGVPVERIRDEALYRTSHVTLSAIIVDTPAALSGPPSVPKSRMKPSLHTKACVSVVLAENIELNAKVEPEHGLLVGNTKHAPWGAFAKGSRVAFVAAPSTWPRSLIEMVLLAFPPSVPRSIICPFRQRTPRTSGAPVSGSIDPFCDWPTISPRSLTPNARLLRPPGSAPRSVVTPFFHTKACDQPNSRKKQFGSWVSMYQPPRWPYPDY